MLPMASVGSAASMPQQLTYINTDGFFVKLWGIADRETANLIRDMIDVYTTKLMEGHGQLRSLSELILGKMVLVFRDNHFQRAEIMQVDGNPPIKVVVNFIDLGIVTSVNLGDIRIADNLISGLPRTSGLAEDFILHGVVAKKQWSAQDVESVNSCLKHCTELNLTGIVGDIKIAQVMLAFNSQAKINLSNFLIESGLADYAAEDSLTNLIRMKYGKTNIPAANQYSVPPPSIPNASLPSSFAIPGQNQLRGPNMTSVYSNDTSQTSIPPTYQRIRIPKPIKSIHSVAPVQSYVYPTLPVDSTHDVVISHVIDGMNAFTVQLKKSCEIILPKLMAQINDIRPVPITEQIGPGALCLGRFIQDDSLCRAVVSNVLADGASLYFVDFGNTEVVPFNAIYRIPPEFLQEPTMALRFTLADLTSVLSTAEAHNIFTSLVLHEDLVFKLKVVKPLLPTQQRCELFIVVNGKTINIKNKILDKVKLMKPVEYKKLQFKKNQIADVIVTYSESPIRFFVQLELNQAILEVIMKCVEDYCINSENKDILYTEDIVENMAVCAPYEDDRYYRGLIVDEPDSEGNINVFYVDYGNSDSVHYSKLRIMNNEMMSQFPTQAIECRLDIDQALINNEEVAGLFIELVDGENFKMSVKNILPSSVLLVDLVDQNGRNIADHLKEVFGVSSPSGYAAAPKPPLSKSSSGNWREKQSSSVEGDFSSFRDERRDERSRPDNRDDRSRADSNSNHFRSSHDDRGRGRNFEPKRRDSDGVDTTDEALSKNSGDFWNRDKGSRADTGEPWRHDKYTNDQSNDRYGSRDRNDRGSYRKREDNDNWNSRNQDDNRVGGGERRFDRSNQGHSKDWDNKTDDEFGGRPKRDGGFRGRREEGGDDFGGRPPRRDDGFNDRPPRRDNRSEDGGFNDRPPRRDGGFNDRPPRRDNRNDGGFNNDNAWDTKNGNSWDNKTDNDAWNTKEKTNDSGWGSSQDNRGGRRDFGNDRGGSFGDDNRGRRDGGFRKRDDNFSSNSDSRGPKQWGDDFGSSSVTLLDGFEKGSKIADADYQPGQEIDSIVSWFVNPVNFYLMPNENADFKNLMEKIQSEYPTRKTLNTNELSPNDFVVARDKDNVIYRATVLRTSPRGVVVTFVDYGNTETVGKSQVWAISPDHCVIPKQAVLCGLHNIASNDENGVWKSTTEYDNYFGKDSFKATLVENVEQDGALVWSVNLIDPDGQNVGDQLVANNLASRKVVLLSEELYDFNLFLNQTVSVFTGALVSSKKFFVHIEPDKADHIGTYIQELTEKPQNLIALPAENIVDGEFCLAPSSDDAYYRALILSVNSDEKQAHVAFIDYGDETDVSFDVLKVLPDYLKTYNPQAVECRLYDSDSFNSDEDFIQNMEEKDFIIKVINVHDDVLHVKLFDVKGNALPYPTESDETVPVVCPAPVLRLFENVVVSSVAAGKAFLQRPSEAHAVNELNDKLFEKYDNDLSQEKVEVEEGKFYVAKSGQFEAWYRCQLLEPGSDRVFYIDYGNTEPIEGLLAIRPLDEEFYNVPACCFPVSTDVDISVESIETLMTAIQDIVFKAVLKNISAEGAPNVEFYADLRTEDGKSFADYVIELNSGSKRDIEPEPSYNAFENWKPNESKNVIVSAFSSPIQFYLLQRDDADKLTQLQDDLEKSLKTVLPLVGSTNILCAAKSIDDEKWYRCNQADNVAIDCGLVIQPSVYKKLPAKFAVNRDKYVVECRLDVSSLTTDWQQDAIDHFATLVKRESDLVATLEEIRNNKMIVDLTSNGISVAETLLTEGLAKYQGYEVKISHAVSLTEFYIQDLSKEDDLFELLDKLKEGENAWETIVPEQGQIVSAKFPDDEQWYRAEVINIVDTDITVLFIDYGNQSICTEFRVLPDELSQVPKFASRCTAHPLPENADELKEKFVAFVEEHIEDLFSVYFLSRHAEPKLVMLYFGEEVIEKMLVDKVEPEAEAQPQRPSLEFKTVSVVHINSPSSFYVQTETPLLDELADRLDEIEQSEEPLVDGMTVGTLYAAKFAEDGVWYRAKAIAANEVLFIDFGNVAVVEEVRNLPENLKVMPILAKHCAFKSPTGLEEWPQVATERFSELTCNGDAVFVMDIVEEGDPAFVQMIDNGLSVVDELSTLCQAELTAPTNATVKPAVIISHVDNINQIWIQEQTPALDELCDELSNVETFDALETSAAEPDAIVAALFDEDGVWYRAKVLEKSDVDCKVLFIDYGNESNVTSIKSLPEDLAGMSAFATKCRLLGLPEDAATSWPSSMLDKLREISENVESFVVLNKEIKDEVTYVSLQYDEATELSQQLIELHSQTDAQLEQPQPIGTDESNEIPSTECNQDQTEISPATADENVPEAATNLVNTSNEEESPNSTCVVTQATSESEFHLQNDTVKVKQIQDSIQSNITEPTDASAAESKNIEPIVGEVVSALDEDQSTSYRSKIDSVDENKESCHVTRIDFGGNFVAKKWTRLPADVTDIAPLALKCSLSIPQYLLEKKPDLTQKFLEVVQSQDATFTYKVVSCEGDVTNVELFKDGVSVLDLLLPGDVGVESGSDLDAADGAVLSAIEDIVTSEMAAVNQPEMIEMQEITTKKLSSTPSSCSVAEEFVDSEDVAEEFVDSEEVAEAEIPTHVETSVEDEIVQKTVPSLPSVVEKEVETGAVPEPVIENDIVVELDESNETSVKNDVNESETFDDVESSPNTHDIVIDNEKLCQVTEPVSESNPESEDVNDSPTESNVPSDLGVDEIVDEKIIIDDFVSIENLESSTPDSVVSEIDEPVPIETFSDSAPTELEADTVSKSDLPSEPKVDQKSTTKNDVVTCDETPLASEIISPESKSDDVNDEEETVSAETSVEPEACKLEISIPECCVPEDLETVVKLAEDDEVPELETSFDSEDIKSTDLIDDQISTSDCIGSENSSTETPIAAESCQVEITILESVEPEELPKAEKSIEGDIAPKLEILPDSGDTKSEFNVPENLPSGEKSADDIVPEPEISSISEDIKTESVPEIVAEDGKDVVDKNSFNAEFSSPILESATDQVDEQIPTTDDVSKHQPASAELYPKFDKSRNVEAIICDGITPKDFIDRFASAKSDVPSDDNSDFDVTRDMFSTPEPIESVESKDPVVEEYNSDDSSETIGSPEIDVALSSTSTLTGNKKDHDGSIDEESKLNQNIDEIIDQEHLDVADIDSSFETPCSPDVAESIYLSMDEDADDNIGNEKKSFDVSLESSSTSVDKFESESLLLDDGADNKNEKPQFNVESPFFSAKSEESQSKKESPSIPAESAEPESVSTESPSAKESESTKKPVFGLTELSFPTNQSTPISPGSKISPRDLVDGGEYCVTCIQNPGHFFVQKVSDLKCIKSMEKHLKAAGDKNGSIVEPQIDSLYSAFYGNSWYRVKFINSDPYHTYRVFCLDYGNLIYVEKLYELPKKLADIEPFAVICGLPLPAHLRKWPKNVRLHFEVMTLMKNPTFELRIIISASEKNPVQMVNLTNSEYDVWQEIKEMCVKIEDDSSSLEDENFTSSEEIL